MVSLDDAVIARLKTHGETFEIFVDPDLALKYKEGNDVKFGELLAAENIFRDASAGKKASEEVMQNIFGTVEVFKVAEAILQKGELHLTTEQKKNMLEEKRKQVVSIIARNAINPQTKTPHPPVRIEKAMEEAKVNVSLFKSVTEQVETTLKAIRPIIPIKFAKVNVAVKIPAVYSGHAYTMLKEFGELKKEEWLGGDLLCMVEIPAGLQDEFYDRLNGATHGEVKIKIVEKGLD